MGFFICTSHAVSTTLELKYLKGVKSRNGDVLLNFGAHFGAIGINKNVILIHHLVNKSSLSAGRKFPKRQWKFIRSFLKPWAVFCFPMCRLQQKNICTAWLCKQSLSFLLETKLHRGFAEITSNMDVNGKSLQLSGGGKRMYMKNLGLGIFQQVG